MGYDVSLFQNFDGRRGNTREHVVFFFDLSGAFAYDADLYMREFYKSLTDQVYKPKSRSVHDYQHLERWLNIKFSYAEAKFSLVGLGQTHQHLGEDLNACARNFHKRAVDCCNTVAKEVRVDVYLHHILEEYWIFLKICLFLLSLG